MTARLNDEQALRIQRLWDERNLDVRAEANFFDVSPETIRRIGRRDTYRHLGRSRIAGDDHRISGGSRQDIPASEVDESLRKLMEQLPEVKIGNAFE